VENRFAALEGLDLSNFMAIVLSLPHYNLSGSAVVKALGMIWMYDGGGGKRAAAAPLSTAGEFAA